MRDGGAVARRRLHVADIARRAQHVMATAIGVDDEHRMLTVVAMLQNNARRAPGYWIQLVLAMGIATLGLVLGSTAVVIGAMLVSPLMGPILELGMGFAVGSSLLVMRASLRVLASIALVVSGAAMLTLALPFHEITTEISTRTAPTALDLLVAAFCALTAAYTTVRPGTDSTAAAAGTAIGIALVPPLCVIGFGLGTFAPSVANGAMLLFTANLSAILVLSVSCFLLLGFNQVDAEIVERDFLDAADTRSDRLAYRVHRMIHRAFGSRYGVAMRILIPTVFLAIVYVPLRRALTEVTWEVRTRETVRRLVKEASPDAMQTALTLDRDALSIRLLMIGTAREARAIEDTLIARVARSIGVRPTVSVVAVSDTRMMRDAAAAAATHVPAPLESPVLGVRNRVATALRSLFPAEAGPLLAWELSVASADTAVVTIHHLGPALGGSGAALLGRDLSAVLASPVRVRGVALPAFALSAPPGAERAWFDTVRVLLPEVVRAGAAVACVEGPRIPQGGRTTTTRKAIFSSLRDSDLARQGRMTITEAPQWRFRVAIHNCIAAQEAGAPGR